MKITIKNKTTKITKDILVNAATQNHMDIMEKIKAFNSLENVDCNFETFMDIRFAQAVIFNTIGATPITDEEFNTSVNTILDEDFGIVFTSLIRQDIKKVFEIMQENAIKSLGI